MKAHQVFQMGISYAHSLFAYHTNGRPRPFSASYVVTNKCNLRCVYCNFPLIKRKELDLSQIETLFLRLKKMGVVRLGLLGGEPMVRKDLPEIIGLAKKMGFFVSLNTNLLLYDRFKDGLEGVDYFFTSIDGPPELHIRNRGKQDFDKILQAMRDIKARGKKVSFITVLTEPERDTVDYLLDLATREKVDVHFQPEGYEAELFGRSAPLNVDQAKHAELWSYLARRKKEGAPITSSLEYLKYISRWDDFSRTVAYDPSVKCSAGRGFLFVDTSGIAFPCCFTAGKVEGVDLLDDAWKKVYAGMETPCTKCIGGPFLEHNLLFDKPVKSSLAALGKAFG